MNPAEAMLSRELLRGELATHDPRGAAAPRTDTDVSREEQGHHNSNQRAHSEGGTRCEPLETTKRAPEKTSEADHKKGKDALQWRRRTYTPKLEAEGDPPLQFRVRGGR
jgi:hypothetical protein